MITNDWLQTIDYQRLVTTDNLQTIDYKRVATRRWPSQSWYRSKSSEQSSEQFYGAGIHRPLRHNGAGTREEARMGAPVACRPVVQRLQEGRQLIRSELRELRRWNTELFLQHADGESWTRLAVQGNHFRRRICAAEDISSMRSTT